MQKQNVDQNVNQERCRTIMFDSYSKLDLSQLSEIQVLQFILFYIFPRKDVTEIAQRLIDRFGSVQSVLEASEHLLAQVDGMNERSAKMLTGFVRIFDYYIVEKTAKRSKIKDWGEIYDICESLVRFQAKETLYVIGFDSALRKVAHKKLSSGSTATVQSSPNIICDFINESKAAYIVLTHNHPGGTCIPSTTDKTTTEQIRDIAKIFHATLIDHIVVGTDGLFSMQYNKQVRSFVDVEEVKKLAKTIQGD